MQDQVKNLRQYGIGIDRIGEVELHHRTPRKTLLTLRRLDAGRLCFLYITPERSAGSTRSAMICGTPRQATARRWPSLTKRTASPNGDMTSAQRTCAWPPTCAATKTKRGRRRQLGAFTGTASYAVLADMRKALGVQDTTAEIRPDSFDREELIYMVDEVTNRNRLPWLKCISGRQIRGDGWPPPASIVFVSRANSLYDDRPSLAIAGVAKVATRVGTSGTTTSAANNPERIRRQRHAVERPQASTYRKTFTNDDIASEIVATKGPSAWALISQDVRYTLHHEMPSSIEAFYQQAGRAGRDGDPARLPAALLRPKLGRWHCKSSPKTITSGGSQQLRQRGAAAAGRRPQSTVVHPEQLPRHRLRREGGHDVVAGHTYLQGAIVELGAAETVEVAVSWRGEADQVEQRKGSYTSWACWES